jgi:molybdenum cofactor cytidylyltransferase
MRLNGDRGAGALLRDLGDQLAIVPAPDDGVLFDIDRPADLDPGGSP